MMPTLIWWSLLFCVAMTSVFAKKCPTGCSCRGPPSDRHTAICFKDKGPSHDFPPSIKTLEIRHVSAGSMQSYLKHAPDVTDLIIHDSDLGDVKYLPPDFFHGMKNIKALTFQKLKHNVAPQGLATAMNGISKLQFLDLTKNQLECSCELLDWISSHHVMLLGVRNLSPSTHCKEAGFDKDTYTSQELIDICGRLNSTHNHEVKHTSSVADRSKVVDDSSSSKVEKKENHEDFEEEEDGEEDEYEDEEDNQDVANPESETGSKHQDKTQAPLSLGKKESVTVAAAPGVTEELFQNVPPGLKNDEQFLKTEYDRTNEYRNTLLSLLDAHRITPPYSTLHPLATIANMVSNKGIVKPTTPQETQSPGDDKEIDYYVADIESILTTSAMKTITTSGHSSTNYNSAIVSEDTTEANSDQGKHLAAFSSPQTKNSKDESIGRMDAEQKPSTDSKHLFLERSSSGGLGSSILDGPVDIRLHPVNPVELKLLIKYLQDVADVEKAVH